MQTLLWVMLGSSIGGGARFLLMQVVSSNFGKQLVFGSVCVNIIGSFLASILIFSAADKLITLDDNMRAFLMLGVLGGFTTFSTFSYETVRLLEEGSLVAAGANILLNVTVCIVAAFVGISLARQM